MSFDFQALAQKGKFFAGAGNVGISPSATVPTTTAPVGLVNTSADAGVSLIISRIHFWLVSGTPALGSTLILSPSVSKIVSPPTSNTANWVVAPTRGLVSQNYGLFQATCTLPATAVWFSQGGSAIAASADIGQSQLIPSNIEGTIIIPPGYGLGIGVFSAAGTTPKFGISITWAEQVLTYQS